VINDQAQGLDQCRSRTQGKQNTIHVVGGAKSVHAGSQYRARPPNDAARIMADYRCQSHQLLRRLDNLDQTLLVDTAVPSTLPTRNTEFIRIANPQRRASKRTRWRGPPVTKFRSLPNEKACRQRQRG